MHALGRQRLRRRDPQQALTLRAQQVSRLITPYPEEIIDEHIRFDHVQDLWQPRHARPVSVNLVAHLDDIRTAP